MSTDTKKKSQQPTGNTLVPTNTMVAAASPVDMIPVPIAGAAQQSEAAQAFLKEAKGDLISPSRIPLINIDHKNQAFTLPTGELVQEVSGYPVYTYFTRRYYKKPPQAGQKGTPPDCWSGDLLKPHPSSLEQQNPTCAGCTMNEFGTGRDGRSKACGQYTWIFLVNKDFGDLPLGVIVAPPSSLRPMWGTRFTQGYFGQAKAKHGAHEIVFTTFGLKLMGDNVQYCVLDPRMGPAADLDIAKQLVGLRNKFIDVMDELRLKTAEVPAGGEE